MTQKYYSLFTMYHSPQFMIILLITHIRRIIEYCSCVWNTGYVQDVKLLENIQRRWTKCISGLETLSYGDRLKALNLHSVQGRLLRADLIQYWKVFNGKSCIMPTDLFVLPPQKRTQGHIHKIFFPLPWPRIFVGALSLKGAYPPGIHYLLKLCSHKI